MQETVAETSSQIEASQAEPNQVHDSDFAKKFAALTRQQKQLLAEKQAMAKEKQELEEWKKRQSLKGENPLEYLKSEGIDVDSLVERLAKSDEPPTVEDKVSQLEKKIQAMLEKEEQAKIETKSRAEKEQLDAFQNKLKNHLKESAEKFPLINALEGSDAVFQVISAHYEKTMKESGEGEILSFDAAAERIEKYYDGMVQKVLALPKYKATEKVQADQAPEKESQVQFPGQTSAKTLTSSVSAAQKPIEHSGPLLSKQASLAQAAEVLKKSWQQRQ